MLDDFDYINSLIPFYEKLLTERQQEIIKYYYYEDLSLTEIAENLNISRNAVYDTIKKTSTLLSNYEKQLHLKKDSDERCELLRKRLSHCDDEGKDILNELISKEEEI
ncbi:MAG: HTH domain-containing protein [Erysipelotrichaceae bacterium]|nr:HTH domain-containing protein [Erysipelotrichaceae bacterium]MBR2746210.1 HTH domain-containing protein [Erysipelotrichaceae bacterium]